MKIAQLISQLQKLLEAESTPGLLELFGEPEIMIDTFVYDEAKKAFDYRGIDHDVVIERSPDGVYLILSRIGDRRKC